MFIAMNPKTGAHLRNATDTEIASWMAGQSHPMFLRGHACFDHAVVVGDVSIAWHVADSGPRQSSSWDWV